MWTTHLKFSAPIFIFSILATACAKKDDHSDADWIYVNQSKYKILIQLDREPYMDEIFKENFTENGGLNEKWQPCVQLHPFCQLK